MKSNCITNVESFNLIPHSSCRSLFSSDSKYFPHFTAPFMSTHGGTEESILEINCCVFVNLYFFFEIFLSQLFSFFSSSCLLLKAHQGKEEKKMIFLFSKLVALSRPHHDTSDDWLCRKFLPFQRNEHWKGIRRCTGMECGKLSAIRKQSVSRFNGFRGMLDCASLPVLDSRDTL